MEFRTIPHTGLKVSRIIAGCMGLGGGWEKDAISASHMPSKLKLFSRGHWISHQFLRPRRHLRLGQGRGNLRQDARASSRPAEKIVIQSKCGIRWADEARGAPHRFDFSGKHILEAVEGSYADFTPITSTFSFSTGPTFYGKAKKSPRPSPPSRRRARCGISASPIKIAP